MKAPALAAAGLILAACRPSGLPVPGGTRHAHASDVPPPGHAHDTRINRAARARPRGPAPGYSSAPSFAADDDGRLWAVWEEGGRVWVSSSPDSGGGFDDATAVNAEPEPVEAGGESRPKLALGPHGRVFVSWTRQLERPYTGVVRFAVSADRGRTFSAPTDLIDAEGRPGHRFDTLLADREGHVTVFWIDKRDREAAVERGEEYAGAAVYWTSSDDGGTTFAPNRKLADHACECCRLAAALDGAGGAVLFWRQVFEDGSRDHALATFASSGMARTPVRATFDEWRINACPHQGPALTVGPAGVLQLAWWTGGGRSGAGLYHVRASTSGQHLGSAQRLSDNVRAAHPTILANGEGLVGVAWLEDREGATRVMARRSRDGGATFADPVEVAVTAGHADHPSLLTIHGHMVLVVFTDPEGLRVVDLDTADPQAP